MKIDDVLNYKIGIIGLGVLGSAIAECFINKKIRLIGYDLSDKFYKKLNKSYFSPIDTLEELYGKCDIILTCLPSEQSLLDVTANIKSKVLIIEDVITTGKSSMECVKLIKKNKAKLVGFASLIDRSTKKSLKIKKKIISHLKIDVPTFKQNELPDYLKKVPITTPGSRFIK